MANFRVNWNLTGFKALVQTVEASIEADVHEAGAIIEADVEAAAEYVKMGVLTLIDDASFKPCREIDTITLNDEELVAYAKGRFDFDLDASLSRDAKLTEILALKEQWVEEDEVPHEPNADGSPIPFDLLTKAQLLDLVKSRYSIDLNARLNKTAILVELAALEAKP